MAYNDWLIQPAKHGAYNYNELYYPGDFLPCWSDLYRNHTEVSSRPGRPYWFLPDEMKCRSFCYDNYEFNRQRLEKYEDYVAHKRPIIELDDVAHFTNEHGFGMIQRQKLIRAYPKYFHQRVTVRGYEQDYQFVWFTATVGDDGAEIIRDSIWNRHREIRHFLHYHLDYDYQSQFMANENNYATSTPFTMKRHPCGDYSYKFNLDQLIQTYKQIIGTSRCSIRRLGTFIYKNEVMYAIVIYPLQHHSLNYREETFFNQFPGIATPNTYQCHDTVIYLSQRRFFWRPFSTSSRFSGLYKSVYCRWDHVAFAFYFPNNFNGFNLNRAVGDYYTY